MKRLSILTALLLALSLLAFGTGFASAKQRTFNADPKAVWAACNTGGSYGSYDPDMGVVCVNPGCDGNANHSCIVDCNNHGQCTGTTPDRVVGVRTLGDLLNDHHKVAPAQPLNDVSATPHHGGDGGAASGPYGRADVLSHIGDVVPLGASIQ